MKDETKTVVLDQVTENRVLDPEAHKDRVFDPGEHGVGSPLTPKAVNLEPVGTDSSSVMELLVKWKEEKDPYEVHVSEWQAELKQGTIAECKESLVEGLALLQEGVGLYNDFLHHSAMTSA